MSEICVLTTVFDDIKNAGHSTQRSRSQGGRMRRCAILLLAAVVASVDSRCLGLGVVRLPRHSSSSIVMCAADRIDGCASGQAADGPVSRPLADLTPVEVIEAQLAALQRGDVEVCFRFASPDNKFRTGPWQKYEKMMRQTPAYSPLVGSERFAVVGALPVGSEGYRCRVRV